ncbi:isoaspartyl peptidase/L-asparaginase [Pontibacter diazotrophicus]|uniref:Isoaspartyl peptidase n=1 Tax=Pontibacter diazotrophicus TaxID=1400979 RepID=A0A3D8LC06_9BACT|nr:isoaspartyl peptidase/L-asparaginase [Pontibacter diazotrophicus]RDV14930.1 isoaspartyl peptidase/L-asparaginase [Pontibacter diazotrophicus]
MSKYAIAIHAGAETVKPETISPEKEKQFREGLQQALQAGYDVLEGGGSALDAVEAAVRSMEDFPLFNAGRGANLNEQGETAFDAAIMDGKNLKAGAVCSIHYVKYPITLARAIMQESKHVLLSGEGAEAFALSQGLEMEAPEYFVTEERTKKWKDKLEEQLTGQHDTVGAVAVDKAGNVAAATSTGGLSFQHKGRVGDSPIIGGGTYAHNSYCAVSCTGEGEPIMKGVLAHEVYAQVKYAGNSLQHACEEAIKVDDDKLQGDKGIIAVSPTGEVAIAFNTNQMKRAYRIQGGESVVAVWKDDTD